MIHQQTDRRGFLGRAITGAAGVIGGPAFATRPCRAATNQADVLIIGAGMSGVAAGQTLLSAGINPIVLEGRCDRIGGRIWSSYAWDDAPVDFGASWLTHASINPLPRIAAPAGITMVPSDLMNLTLRTANGQVLPQDVVSALWALYFATYAGVKAYASDRNARRLPDIPASRGFDAVLAQEQLSPRTRQKLGFFLNYAIQEPEASLLSDPSLYHWDDDLVFVQLFMRVFPKGYVQLVDYLAAGLDIRMGHVVNAIDYGPLGVTARTSQGDFQARYAIVTLPHGVLAKGSLTFSPPCPPGSKGPSSGCTRACPTSSTCDSPECSGTRGTTPWAASPTARRLPGAPGSTSPRTPGFLC